MSGPSPFPATKRGMSRVGLALAVLALLSYLATVAGAWLVGGPGWALLVGGLVALVVALRADLL